MLVLFFCAFVVVTHLSGKWYYRRGSQVLDRRIENVLADAPLTKTQEQYNYKVNVNTIELMKELKASGNVKALEDYRVEMLRILIVISSLVFGVGFLLAIYAYHPIGYWDWTLNSKRSNFVWYIYIFLSFIFIVMPFGMFSARANESFMPALARVFPGLEWRGENKNIDKAALRESGLIASFNQVFVQDCLRGAHGKITYDWSMINVFTGSGKYRQHVFSGAYIKMKLPQESSVQFILRGKRIGEIKSEEYAGLRILNAPSLDFSETFTAYADDRVLGRVLLAPDAMEKLILMARSAPGLFDISLKKDTLCLLVKGISDLEPASLFTKVSESDDLHYCLGYMLRIMSLIEFFAEEWKLEADRMTT